MEFHEKTGRFPGILVEPKRRIAPLINWMSWFVVVMISLSYILYNVFTSGNLYLMITTTLIFISGKQLLDQILNSNKIIIDLNIGLALSSVYLMIGSTKIKKGSEYGNQTNSQSNTKSVTNPNNNIDENSALRQRLNANPTHSY